jgi:hypothetical protein
LNQVPAVTALLTEVDPSITAALLAAAMLVAWAGGWRWGQYLRREGHEELQTKLDESLLALLGLLLAFTFSISLARHDQRRQMLVADSNAIGDFYTCASLLNEPVRGKLRSVLREYVELRLSVASPSLDEATLQRRLDESQRLQDAMQGLVKEAVDDRTPVVVPLVNTLNEVTSSHAARLSAGRERLPPSVVLLLVLVASVAMALNGRHPGIAGRPRIGAAVGFAALVGMVLWVTLDLNQPHRGWITLSQEPLLRLLQGMTP